VIAQLRERLHRLTCQRVDSRRFDLRILQAQLSDALEASNSLKEENSDLNAILSQAF
jgi:hypothetical protein